MLAIITPDIMFFNTMQHTVNSVIHIAAAAAACIHATQKNTQKNKHPYACLCTQPVPSVLPAHKHTLLCTHDPHAAHNRSMVRDDGVQPTGNDACVMRAAPNCLCRQSSQVFPCKSPTHHAHALNTLSSLHNTLLTEQPSHVVVRVVLFLDLLQPGSMGPEVGPPGVLHTVKVVVQFSIRAHEGLQGGQGAVNKTAVNGCATATTVHLRRTMSCRHRQLEPLGACRVDRVQRTRLRLTVMVSIHNHSHLNCCSCHGRLRRGGFYA